ncbi:DNA recombination protein RmuC [Francisella noatunensis]|uniref:DNA recombination protein RmuC n=1 Tax=Francisella noatunensis TaxID=657445 RepID=A0A9Q2KUS8_9GAMM|nr:DNA recombination protein RmuC [Francisella noatunensis]MBK2028630.1 DNA recombination protein RmuC [Francisella noatunensis]MBK2033380.1 DNA recombination protein RmuC [Francisella noatunensis]MBK2048173.1 DNA recombination protein RmuC [Francisella noatunensis]MBK2049655.1 DNA recombination protein RmuC [Francisella noatunensis]MBK2051210.1 DNA recombination protein RmuC [Francisella noatunensis]
MILAIALIVLLVICGIVPFFILNKRSIETKHIRTQFEDYKNSVQQELLSLRSKELTFDTLLDQEKQKNLALKQDNTLRIDELKQELKEEREKSYSYIEEIKNYRSQVSMLETQLKEQNTAMQDKLELLQNSEAKLKTEFENLASKIFEDNSKKLNERNQESLNSVLNPVREQLKDFKQKVEDVYDKESIARGALQNELKTLKELNQKMTAEAHNLTNALRGSTKQQGIWGEMVLENVLEKSGLREGFEYFCEKHTTDDEGKAYRPDVVVKLPDSRDIIIDAKTSLFAYNDYMAADEEQKQAHLKAHIRSIREHIKGLANKSYENLKGINSLDFIFMFIPVEGALLVALDNDTNLYDEAFKQKIILVSPTTLLVALRAVENTWRYEKQAQSITDIYSRAEELYKKFVGFVEDLEKVGKSIADANKSYENAFSKLKTGRGNLIGQVEKLKVISNIKPKKELENNLVENAMGDNE